MRTVIVEDLELARPGFRLGPIGFEVPAGGRFAIVGPSGSGKTTLLRCLAGFETPNRGRIRIGDTKVFGDGRSLPPDRRELGFVFQDAALWPHLTAVQHLRFAAPQLDDGGARALLASAGIAHLAIRKPTAMSGGEAQRLGLLRAIAGDPAVLLLDEPLRSVDVHRRDELVLLLRRIADERGLTTILVTHDRDEALALATDLLVLHDGVVVESGPADALLATPRTAFTAAFLGGAACLPTAGDGNGALVTMFGTVPRPAGNAAEWLLTLMPGDVAASPIAENPADAPRGRVLTCTPGQGDIALRVACADRILTATASRALPPGTEVALRLQRPPRLLPWNLRDANP